MRERERELSRADGGEGRQTDIQKERARVRETEANGQSLRKTDIQNDFSNTETNSSWGSASRRFTFVLCAARTRVMSISSCFRHQFPGVRVEKEKRRSIFRERF